MQYGECWRAQGSISLLSDTYGNQDVLVQIHLFRSGQEHPTGLQAPGFKRALPGPESIEALKRFTEMGL